MEKMPIELSLTLLAVIIIGCGCRAEPPTHHIGSQQDSVLTKMVKLENRINECLTGIKAQIYELQQHAFQIEDLQRSRHDQNPIIPSNHQMCPCGSKPTNFVRSCKTLKGQPSGRYMVTASNTTFEAYCEQELDDGGWTVIQNRYDGSVDFYRNWASYRNGFGDLNGEFWLGLEQIYKLTSSGDYELSVHVEDFSGTKAQARYSKFAISGEGDQYKLIATQFTSGTSGLSSHNGRKFSTYDKDNDADANRNCAQLGKSGWWHQCYEWSNLNGMYQNGQNSGDGNYSPLMTWWSFKGYSGLKKSKMMIREA